MTCIDPKTEYRSASFKGVPFKVVTETATVGRRGDLYEYPHGETTGWRDLGRAAQSFQVEGYLIGDDHHIQAAQMKAAAESPGPGVLVHPIYGEVTVACRSLSISHDVENERRVTRLTFDFVEVGGDVFAPVIGGLNSFFSAIDSFIDLATSVFKAVWDFEWATASSRPSLGGEYRKAADAVYGALRASGHATRDTMDAYTVLEVALRDLDDKSAETVSFALHRGIEVVYQTAEPDDAYSAIFEVTRWASNVTYDVPERNAERMVDGLYSFLARIGLAYSVLAFTDRTNVTVDEVMSFLSEVIGILDAEMQLASERCDDETVRTISELRPALISRFLEMIYGAGGDVRYAYEIDTPDGVPSLVLAHEIYGDSRRAAEIEANNSAFLSFAAGRRVKLFTE